MIASVLFFVLIVMVHVVPIWCACWLLLRWMNARKPSAPTATAPEPLAIAGNWAPPRPPGATTWSEEEAVAVAAARFFTNPRPTAPEPEPEPEEEPEEEEPLTMCWQGNLFSGKTAAQIIEEDGWPVFDENGKIWKG